MFFLGALQANAAETLPAGISGKITAPAGVDLSNARVEAYPTSGADSYAESANVGSDGNYKVIGLPAGTYKLKFSGYNTGALDQWHSNAASFETATAVSLST